MCWWQAFICNGLSKLQLLNEGTRSLPLGLRVLPHVSAGTSRCLRSAPTKCCVSNTAPSDVSVTRPAILQIIQYVHRTPGTLIALATGSLRSGSHDRGGARGVESSVREKICEAVHQSKGPATCTEVHIRAAIVRWAGLLEFQPAIPEIWGKKLLHWVPQTDLSPSGGWLQ